MDSKTKVTEQKRVTAMIKKIDQRLAQKRQELAQAQHETSAVQRNYGDNTRVNITEADDRIETNAAVQQQKQLVAHTVENEAILKKQIKQLLALRQSPYFGRIDIDEAGEKETLYIGTASFIDDQQHFLIYDWRAPISGIYYNGTLGTVRYQTPNGTRQAKLLKKRQFLIEHGQIKNLFDTNETVGDSLLQYVLGTARNDYMKNIVATIQQEQNDIIRDTHHDVLMVQGVAGSGKTSAILQRIAFLLYHSRESLNSEQMILFSPNRLFSHYIADVLPSLGEKNIRQVTLAEFLNYRFSGLQVETLFDRYEQDQANFPPLAQQIRHFKESLAYMSAIDTYLAQLKPSQLAFTAIYANGQVFFSQQEIQTIYAQLPEKMLAADKFLATKNTLIKRLKHKIKTEATADWVAAEIDILSDERYRQIIGHHHFTTGDAEWRFIAEAIVRKRFAVVYDALYNDYFIDIYQQYSDFMASVPQIPVPAKIWQTMMATYRQQLERHYLRLADATPLLYLRDQLTGSGQNHALQHLFIDEMQDYTPAQLRYIRHAFPNAKFTLLGDHAQDLFTGEKQIDFQRQLPIIFQTKRINVITLNKSYRSTYPITKFAAAMLGDNNQIEAFNRQGRQPQLVTTTTATDSLQQISQKCQQLRLRHETVAILTKNQATSDWLFARLKLDSETTLLTDTDRALPKGIVILPIYLAKGLEFAAVIAYNVAKSQFKTTQDQHILYTMASRAMHELILISQGGPCRFIQQIPTKLVQRQSITKSHTAP